MKRSFLALALLSMAASCSAQTQSSAPLRPGTLLQTDFENGAGWPKSTLTAVGTIDVAGSTQPSRGLASGTMISSGPLALRNSESNLGKLTLAFMLSASAARPVVVRVESFDKAKKRTGGLFSVIYPAAPDFYQRYALDLDKMKPSATGKFAPNAPFLSFSFAPTSNEWKGIEKPAIRLDNVQFAKPAWYVSATGDDTRDGRSEATAFATPQKAVSVAGPGDIIAVMNGTYLPTGVQTGIVKFEKTGTPAGWISLKNYPGHTPLFSLVRSWGAIRWHLTKEEVAERAAAGTVTVVPSYTEVRGMHVRGEGDIAKVKYPALIGQQVPETNGNGISVGWWTAGPTDAMPHHLRFADNLVEFCPGGGIGPGQADRVQIENNVVRNNCWTTVYATSGISLNHTTNFDGTKNQYTILIQGNESSGNRIFLPWHQGNKISDGNGIIVDINQEKKLPEEQRHQGRTLIQNNLVFNNGGSGIHTFISNRVDIINNTIYMNSTSPELTWGQMFVQSGDDIRMINNIVVAPSDQPVNTVGTNLEDNQNFNIVRAGNLYFGGGTAPIMGATDRVGDPMFVNPSPDAAIADFRLKPGSPALKSGQWESFLPVVDIKGKSRPLGKAPDKGALQN